MQQGAFLFGASTSAHQVEGDNRNNDWWEFEKTLPPSMRSGKATDHFHRYEEDFLLAKQLSHTAQRISLEWSRIEPTQGRFSRDAIEHYRKVLGTIRGHGMKTFVTLHHFTNPLWFSRKGGWLAGDAPEYFASYARCAAAHLGDLVDFWITFNEPVVYAGHAYGTGDWPPGKKNSLLMVRVVYLIAQAHNAAYRVLHHMPLSAPVGIAKHVVANLPPMQRFLFNHAFFSLTKNSHDFIGVNYYFSHNVTGDVKSDMGWTVSPEGLTSALLEMKRYGKPMYVTENGIADEKDAHRAQFIRSHIRAIEQAQKQGADVRGYLHWSLIDNFEWAYGFAPRFGLVAVNYETMKRTIRPSAYVYKAIIDQALRKSSHFSL